MTVEQVRRYLRAQPFRPFYVHLPDARTLFVRHPEQLILSTSGRTADIYSSMENFETVDLLLIVSLRQQTDREMQYFRNG